MGGFNVSFFFLFFRKVSCERILQGHHEAISLSILIMRHGRSHCFPDPWADLESRAPLRIPRNYPVVV